MIKIITFLLFFILFAVPMLQADQWPANDQDFINELSIIKNPFESGLPKPVIVPPASVTPQAPVMSASQVLTKPIPPPEVVTLPALKLEGVMVGEDVHQAIINDQVVSLRSHIDGAKVIAVTSQGVTLLYKGKKFFLKVE